MLAGLTNDAPISPVAYIIPRDKAQRTLNKEISRVPGEQGILKGGPKQQEART